MSERSAFFQERNGQLCAEDVPVQELAARYGTPLYVYSRGYMQTQYRALAQALAPAQPLICYSAKANTNRAVLRTFLEEGAGLDIVSGGELFRAMRAGADPEKIVFAGVGKTHEEIDAALHEGVLFFTVESEPEVRRISDCAARMGTTGRIAFRINPDVDPHTHTYISTGKRENKFGLDLDRAEQAYALAATLPNIEISGLHLHIGSQLLSSAPYGEALDKVAALCGRLQARYPTFRYLDIGGGLGISYRTGETALAPEDFAAVVLPRVARLGLKLVVEPGRSLVGNGGILVCRVQYVKESYDKQFVIVDAAMNDLIRPSLYHAHHEVRAVRATAGTLHGDLVGPVCESGDFLAQDRDLPDVGEGGLLAIMSAGAYGYAMSSNYNSRRRPAEVLVDGASHLLVRRRETWEDVVRHETDGRDSGQGVEHV
ncbi:MAG: diaminopimelate decarboxylase [bacterium]